MWWVVLCIALCFALYAHGSHKKRTLIHSLQGELGLLQKERETLTREKEELLLNIQSESDPAWVEMTLIKVLGLVPEGKVKVYFSPSGE
jgi:hypothetical protein